MKEWLCAGGIKPLKSVALSGTLSPDESPLPISLLSQQPRCTRPDSLPSRCGGYTLPGKIVKPCALNDDSDAPVYLPLSFKPKLVFALLAFKLGWKSSYRSTWRPGIFHGRNMPMGISMFPQALDGIDDQLVNRIDVTTVKTPDGIVFNQGNPFDRRSVGGNKETVDSVSHLIGLLVLRRIDKILTARQSLPIPCPLYQPKSQVLK
jgi:hypothetical protein